MNRRTDPSRYRIHVDQSHVSIIVYVLTDLYPLIQSCLTSAPFPSGVPPTLVYGKGPWTGDNLCTALEFFFQTNAYHPQASCDTCGHSGSIPLSLLADFVSATCTSPDSTTCGDRPRVALDGGEQRREQKTVPGISETETPMLPSPGTVESRAEQVELDTRITPLSPSPWQPDTDRPDAGPSAIGGQGHAELGPQSYESRPAHRRIVQDRKSVV